MNQGTAAKFLEEAEYHASCLLTKLAQAEDAVAMLATPPRWYVSKRAAILETVRTGRYIAPDP